MDQKRCLLATVAGASLLAAMPAAAAPPAPVYSWTGFYIGANAGGSIGRSESSYVDSGFGLIGWPTSFSGHEQLNGFAGGGQVGYNWQLTGWVAGLEADFQGTSEKGSTTFNAFGNCEGVCTVTNTQSGKISSFGTVRGRFGPLVTPTLWLYSTVGLAYGNVTGSGSVTDTNCACSWSYSKSATNVGLAAGVGMEGLLPLPAGKWSWKVEYLYINLGSVGGTGIDPDFGTPYTWSAKFTDNIVRFGLNLHLP